MHPSVHCSQDVVGIKISIDGEMDKEYLVHMYNGILVTKKNEIMPFAATWMDLETDTQSEVSQTEKDKYCMKLLICGI